MRSLLKLIPLDAARRALGATGPAAGDPSGTVRQGPCGRRQPLHQARAVAVFAPYSASPRWSWAVNGDMLTDAQVADWPIVASPQDDTTDQPQSRPR